jgi:natural product precursor
MKTIGKLTLNVEDKNSLDFKDLSLVKGGCDGIWCCNCGKRFDSGDCYCWDIWHYLDPIYVNHGCE